MIFSIRKHGIDILSIDRTASEGLLANQENSCIVRVSSEAGKITLSFKASNGKVGHMLFSMVNNIWVNDQDKSITEFIKEYKLKNLYSEIITGNLGRVYNSSPPPTYRGLSLRVPQKILL